MPMKADMALAAPPADASRELSPELATELGANNGASANVRRMRAENLFSFVVLSSRDIDADRAELKRLNEWVAPHFSYYEIMIIADQAGPAWRDAMRALAAEIPKFRILSLEAAGHTDSNALTALEHAIGDFVVLHYPQEAGIGEIDHLLTRLAEGQADLIKTHFSSKSRSPLERGVARAMQWLLRVITGRRFARFPARVTALSRAAVTRITEYGGPLRFFRLIDVSDILSEERLVITGGRRAFWEDVSLKARITGEVVSVSAPRMIRLLAMLCFALGVASFLAMILAFVIWLTKADVAPGWTSQIMLFSFLFGSNFLVLGAVCLGLVRLLNVSGPHWSDNDAMEISSGDLFQSQNDLNVEQDSGDTK
ncbi:MAG: hypothetical protein ACWA5A_04330 [Marinibacterium sp.]